MVLCSGSQLHRGGSTRPEALLMVQGWRRVLWQQLMRHGCPRGTRSRERTPPCGDKPHNKKLDCAQAENHGQAFLLLLAPV